MNLKITALALLLMGSASFSACKKDDDNKPAASNTVQLKATINAQQEVPTNSSKATGTMTGSYDKTTRMLSYTITYQGITPMAGHFHVGAPGVNGGTFVTLNVASSPITGTATLTEADAAKLLANETYVNFHTQAYPNGEIRGNVAVQ